MNAILILVAVIGAVVATHDDPPLLLQLWCVGAQLRISRIKLRVRRLPVLMSVLSIHLRILYQMYWKKDGDDWQDLLDKTTAAMRWLLTVP